jgi:hypothetical protein
MRDTLHPIQRIIDQHHLVPQVGLVLPPVHTNNSCHGTHLFPLFDALSAPISFVDKGHCANTTLAMDPRHGSSTFDDHLLKWAGPCPAKKDTRIIILDRVFSRRITNIAEMTSALKTELDMTAEVITLQDHGLQKQIRLMTCGYPVVSGVHGAGLAWTHLFKRTGKHRSYCVYYYRTH